MRMLFVPALILATSAVAYWIGLHNGLSRSALGLAVGRTMEMVGLGVLFFSANVGITIVVALVARAFGAFMSIYVAADPAILCLSLVQAVLVQHWRYARTAS